MPGRCRNRCASFFTFITHVDSLDWKGLDVAAIKNRIFSRVQSGSIMLYHNDAAHTYEALPDLLAGLKEKGFKPVTVSELVEENLEVLKQRKE